MPKPTLIQNLLNRPTKSYSFPNQIDYFSTKEQVLRRASESDSDEFSAEHGVLSDQHVADHQSGRESERNQDELSDEPEYLRQVEEEEEQSPRPSATSSGSNDEDSDSEIFYTPNASPRASMATTATFSSIHQLEGYQRHRTIPNFHQAPPRPTIAVPAPAPTIRLTAAVPPSPNRTIEERLHDRLLEPNYQVEQSQLSSASASSSVDSAAEGSEESGAGVSSGDRHAVNTFLQGPQLQSSAYSSSWGTRSDTVDNDSGPGRSGVAQKEETYEKEKRKKGMYTDEDWAKDVRWLVPPEELTKSDSVRRKKKKRSKEETALEPRRLLAQIQAQRSPQRHQAPPPPPPLPQLRKPMSAVLEEEEPSTPSLIPKSTTMTSGIVISGPSRLRSPSRSNSTSRSESKLSRSQSAKRTDQPLTFAGLARSQSARGGTPQKPALTASSSTPSALRSVRHKRSSSLPPSPKPFQGTSSSSSAPYAPELPSVGTPGFTSLTLPRAPPSLAAAAKVKARTREGKIDLTVSGEAQTTMASVEVVRGLGATAVQSLNKGGISGMFARWTGKDGKNGGSGEIQRRFTSGGARSDALGFTAHRKPPSDVPAGGVLVQVWAVAVDEIDAKLVGAKAGGVVVTGPSHTSGGSLDGHGWRALRRGASLSRKAKVCKGKEKVENGAFSPETTPEPYSPRPHHYLQSGGKIEVGFIPGRSFVGRVLECGWEVETIRRGDWVAGLLDLRKCGGLAEFIVVDRKRLHRVPHPKLSVELLPEEADPGDSRPLQPTAVLTSQYPAPGADPRRLVDPLASLSGFGLTLPELALLPLTGVPAHRAVRTLAFTFSTRRRSNGNSPNQPNPKLTAAGAGSAAGERGRRVLVLWGHAGCGALVAQMLCKRGWRVCVHAPPGDQAFRKSVEVRARGWGAEGVVFDKPASGTGGERQARGRRRDSESDQSDDEELELEGEGHAGTGEGGVEGLLVMLARTGEQFDAIVDTIGGRDVWKASQSLLKARGGQFTTLVGDAPERPIPSAKDHFKAGLRALRLGGRGGADVSELSGTTGKGGGGEGKVGYAWVSATQDVDWEGQDVGGSIGSVLRMALEEDIRPVVTDDMKDEEGVTDGGGEEDRIGRIVPFERAPGVFAEGNEGLKDGATAVIIIVG